MMFDKNMLEFWGKAFLHTAHTQQIFEDINKMLGLNKGVENPFALNTLFNWQNIVVKNTEYIIDLYEKLSSAHNELMKDYLTMFNVVSEKKHSNVLKENEELKAKISELEKILDLKINKSTEINYYPKKIVDNLTQVVSDQTQQFQELLKQLNQPHKKTSNMKKNIKNNDDNIK
ncbi:MAG: hypothetical protein ABFD50_15650 [Smithella sp.]